MPKGKALSTRGGGADGVSPTRADLCDAERQGVEHSASWRRSPPGSIVPTSVMPKGVETTTKCKGVKQRRKIRADGPGGAFAGPHSPWAPRPESEAGSDRT